MGKRQIGEVYEEYRKRLREISKNFRERIRSGIRFVPIPVKSGHGKNIYLPADMKTKSPYSKMHRGESFKDFRDRRKVSNKRRRSREKAA